MELNAKTAFLIIAKEVNCQIVAFVTINDGQERRQKTEKSLLRRYAANNWQNSTSCLYLVE